MEKMTILNILRQENNARPKSYLESKPSYCTLLEKDIMIKRTAEELIRATKIIMRALSYKRFRRLRRENTYIADIYFEADPDIAKEILLVGEFSSPQWIQQIPMQYSYFHRAFRTRIKIKQGSEFKFIVDGTFICCPKYPRVTTGSYTNNIFKKNPNPSGFNKSFHYKGVKVILEDNKWKINPLNSIGKSITTVRPNQLNSEDFSYFNSLSQLQPTHDPNPSLLKDDKKKEFGFGIKHLQPQKSAKTPLQTIQNPLKSMISCGHNQSSRDLGSEYSDDDLPFLDDFFDNMPFTPDIGGHRKEREIYGNSSPIRKEILESYTIVGQGVRLSKNKNPCQDAFFTTQLGIGIADGVGGWNSYGIDSSLFSSSLMNQCKQIIKSKEYGSNNSSSKAIATRKTIPNYEYQQSTVAEGQNTFISQGRDFSKMEGVFGSPMKSKIRKIRSSFHLSDQELHECQTHEGCDKSPTSENACVEIKQTPRLDPQQILKQAFRGVKDFGSSTACIGALDGKTLKIANIGDSTMMVVRYNPELKASKIVLRTGEQQHSFNAPYQLANIPIGLQPSSSGFGGSQRRFWKDKASDAVLYQTSIREGDIIIGGTDGLFDNLYSHEILNITDVFLNDCFGSSPQESLKSVNTHSFTPVFTKSQLANLTKRKAKLLAHDLVKEARRKSKNKTCLTPFADRFNKSKIEKKSFLVWKGGKPDDICAVIGFVKTT